MSEESSIDSIFCAAIEIESPEERGSYLERVCGGDAELKHQVERLVDAHFEGGSILDAPAGVQSTTVDQPITEVPGDTIGPYKLLQELGEGGMGTVYMAEQEEPVRRRVALKIIKPGMDSKQVIARFEAERQALAMMDHQNIARVLDAGTTNSGRPYFAMELVKGVPIIKYCDHNRLTVRERLELFVPVCQAIQHAHQKGIIHRDIKPSNVLVTLYDGKPVPKVIDFGIAKATQQKLTERTMFTQMGQIVGTLEYMSPEQAEMNALDVDTRSDVYSLGVMLYELLTGTTPITGQQLRQGGFAQMLAVIHDYEPPKPSTRLSESGDALPSISAVRKTEPARLSKLVRGDLDWIVMKALEKDRTRRYETANGLAGDIGHFLRDEAVAACPPSAAYKLRKFARRNRATLVMVSAVATILLLATCISIWQAVRATQAGRLASERLVEAETERDRANRERDRAVAAEELAAERLRESEQAREDAEAVSTFLSEVFASPDPRRDGRTFTVAEMLDRAVERLATDLANQPHRQAVLRRAIARSYHGLGLTDTAIPLQELVRDYFLEQSGPEHPNTIRAMRHLADSHHHVGRRDEALKLREQILELHRKILGAEHYNTLRAMSNLANSYHVAGRREEALQLREQALERYRESLGAEHPNTLAAMINLADSYDDAGRLDEALQLREQGLELHRKILGTERPNTLTAMSKLASSYRDAGRGDEALELCQQVLELSRKSRGAEHPDTLSAMGSLAKSYHAVGRWDEALQLRKQILELHRKILGAEHPETLSAMGSLANSYRDVGQPKKALQVHEQAFELHRKIFGAGHPDTLAVMINLANTCEAAGRREKALQLREQALELQRKTLGVEHRNTLAVMSGLANSYYHAGRLDDALRLQKQVVELTHKILGAEHHNTLMGMYNLALYYRVASQWDNALELMQQVLALRRKSLGAEHPDTLTAMSSLAWSYHDAGRWDEAIQLAEQALALSRKILGAEHPATVDSMSSLASLYHNSGRNKVKALQLHEQALELNRKIFGAADPHTLMSMGNLAVCYRDAGREDEALQLIAKVLESREGLVQENPSVPGYRRALAQSYGARASLLATGRDEAVRNGPLAVKDATRACELTDWKEPRHLDDLAAAYAESGDFEQAVKYQEKALQLAPERMKEAFEQRLGLFKAGQPYRDGAAAESPVTPDE